MSQGSPEGALAGGGSARRPPTLLEILRTATRYLQEKGINSARLDAELLLAHTLGISRLQLYVQHDRPFEPAELAAYRQAIARRAARWPLAYIVGEKEFFGRTFAVDARVLIPRPETEHLVEVALARLGADQAAHVLDLGTGSGAIAVSLACERPQLHVWATDVSAEALAVAAENARRHGVEGRIRFARGDGFGALPARCRGGFAAILSNPPYIAAQTLPRLAPELRYEPSIALTDGKDGLSFYRRLAAEAALWLAPEGWLACEIGADQAKAVRRIFEGAGWTGLQIVHDLAGHPRVAIARPSMQGQKEGRQA